MHSSTTEAVTHLSYSSEPPTVFEPRLINVVREVAPRHMVPSAHAVGLSRTASIRLSGNASIRLMLQRGLTAINNTKGII